MKHLLTKLLLFFVPVALQAQVDNTHVAWVDTQLVDGKKIFVGWFQNNSTLPMQVDYQAKLKLVGKPEQLVDGSTLSLPSSPTLLTKVIFTLEQASFDYLKLTVKDAIVGDLLAESSILTTPNISELIKRVEEAPIAVWNPTTEADYPMEVEFGGLIIDETRSKTARDFFEIFYGSWTATGINTNGRNIFIKEKPGRVGIGAIVFVEVDDQQVTQLNLQPRTEVLEILAGQLVTALEGYLNDPSNSAEIEGDDISGSGIY